MKRFLFSIGFVGILLFGGALESHAQTGQLQGTATDRLTGEPLIGVNVILKGTPLGSATRDNGSYQIPDVPVGIYTIIFSMLGYEKKVQTNVSIRPEKTTFLSAELDEQVLSGSEVVVTAASYFSKDSDAPTSVRTLGYEEIRRSPGAREDISRMIQNLPGVNPTGDDRNDLVVRGGSPSEALFLVDRIEIPNPNHFGTQGASGGPISMLNTELIKNVEFFAGGFPAPYGGRISAVLDVHYREGDRHRFGGKADLNMGGAGVNLEGPIRGGRGSWIFAAHRSYLEVMESVLDAGGVPIYTNLQGKMVYDLRDDLKLSIIGLGGLDEIEIEQEPDKEDYEIGERDTSEVEFIVNKTRQFSIGSNLTKLWGHRLFSNLTLFHSYNRFYIDYNIRDSEITRPDDKLELATIIQTNVYDNTSTEQITGAKNDWRFVLPNRDQLNWGASAKVLQFDHDIVYQPYDSLNAVGGQSEPNIVSVKQDPTTKIGAYVSFIKRFPPYFELTIGGRYDYFHLLETHDFGPRIGAAFHINKRLTVNAASGIYYQSPEFVFITGDSMNRENLKSLRCEHYIAGFDYLLTEATLFSAEIYRKNYSDYPISSDPDFAFYSTANSGGDYGSVGSDELISQGKGRAIGLELLLQKKLISGLYGMISYSLSKVEHQAMDKIYRSGEFDNRHVFNLVAGYRLSKSWELSLKYRYSGGRPYTPFDESASIEAGRDQLDTSRINDERFAPYHRLDLRFDHRKYFKKFVLVTYFSIENVYNRENEGDIFWNEKKLSTDNAYQTGIFPIGGISLEF
ncbi:MAG: hypothetical protein B6244_11640 [Candidatus Cloacimonetes bacterium 4572_55]|nr:MAG: hypothetical protein B6244_11640 [Candidatus Cloacimonetes bacterium 4572_55]